MHHKIFTSKEDYNDWVKENPAIELLNYNQIEEGIYIEYIQMKYPKKIPKRDRRWSENLYQ